MKKTLLVLLAMLLLGPSDMLAAKYNSKRVVPFSSPFRMPSRFFVNVTLDGETGELVVMPNYDVAALSITIMGNGVTYLDTTVSLMAGQSFTDCLDYLGTGAYMMTLSTVDGVIDQYEISVEDD